MILKIFLRLFNLIVQGHVFGLKSSLVLFILYKWKYYFCHYPLQVKLYDLRSFDKGPFVTFNLPQERQCEWTGLKFSPNGQSILLTTNGSVMRLIEAFQGQPLQTFAGHLNNKGIAVEGCFSPDSKFVFSGSTDGRVHIWDADSGKNLKI